MIEILETGIFREWLNRLADQRAQIRIRARIDRLAHGNPGDTKPVGEGVSELRIDFGPGYRVYYIRRATVLVILLCGGNKDSQEKDIKRAKALALEWKD
jgi:putative addiction module killer protein